MRGAGSGSPAARGVDQKLAEEALRSFLRGGTWPGLARELAWQAVCASGVEHGCLEWLADLAEARLAERVESLEFVIERARAAGRTEHLQTWQHDFAEAETAAVLEGQEEAAQALGRLYMETLEWLIGLVHERLQSPRRASTRARLPAPKQARPPVPVDPPALVTDLVGRPRERFGWPSLHRT